VLLPAVLWSRRRYGALVIMTVLVLGAEAAAAGRAAARSWRSRFASRAGVLRDRLAGLLPQVSGEEAARPAAPSGSPSGDCLAVLDAVTRGLRRFPGMAGLAACEAAAHLSAALWLAPAVPSLRFNTSLLPVAAIAVS
jgi:hypothetical protein